MTSDILHAINLGTMKNWCKLAIWTLIRAGTWGESTQDEQLHIAILAINNQLDAWYKKKGIEKILKKNGYASAK